MPFPGKILYYNGVHLHDDYNGKHFHNHTLTSHDILHFHKPLSLNTTARDTTFETPLLHTWAEGSCDIAADTPVALHFSDVWHHRAP